MSQILERLINLTIEQKEMYPSIQAKIWGSIGQIPELIDMVLDNFIQKSVTSGLGSQQVEIMADTAVALGLFISIYQNVYRICFLFSKFSFSKCSIGCEKSDWTIVSRHG